MDDGLSSLFACLNGDLGIDRMGSVFCLTRGLSRRTRNLRLEDWKGRSRKGSRAATRAAPTSVLLSSRYRGAFRVKCVGNLCTTLLCYSFHLVIEGILGSRGFKYITIGFVWDKFPSRDQDTFRVKSENFGLTFNDDGLFHLVIKGFWGQVAIL